MSMMVRNDNSQLRRILGPLLTVVLIVGVGLAIWYSAGNALDARRIVTVRGLIGSEKEEFFRDERVIAALRSHQLVAEVTKAGSRQIATDYTLSDYDFAFPAGVPGAEKARQSVSGSKSYDTFFTPMAVASWRPIAEILVANGIATDHGGYYTLDMAAYLALVDNDVRWSDLSNSEAYDVNKRILITSTDIRKSNSAAMYLALSSYVWNNNSVVQNANDPTLSARLQKIFLEQGYTENSSAGPFEDYLMMGMGKAPVVMIYEAQYITQTIKANSMMNEEMVLLYPEPTIFTKHILVAFSDGGNKLGDLLQNDPELQKLAIEHGFRNGNLSYQRQYWSDNKVELPQDLIDVIEPPSYEVLEALIQQIEAKY